MPFEWWQTAFVFVYACLTFTLIVLKLCKIGARRRGAVKMLTSLAFVAVGCYGMALRSGLSILLFVGLCFASIGDFLLIFRAKRTMFVSSVISFACASAALSVYSVLNFGWRWWSTIFFALFMAFVISGQRFGLFGFGRNKIVLNIYTSAVGVCGSLGFALMIPWASATQFLFGMGCFLYLASDVCLGLFLYKFRNRYVDAANTILYFPGMLLVAISLLV